MADSTPIRTSTFVIVSLIAFGLALLANRALAVVALPFCPLGGCWHYLLDGRVWLAVAQMAVCVGTGLLFLLTRPRVVRQGWLARLWPLYLFVVFLAIDWIAGWLVSGLLPRSLAPGLWQLGLDTTQKLVIALLYRPPLIALVAALVALLVVLRTCFRVSESVAGAGLSRRRSAFLSYLLVVTVISTSALWIHGFAAIAVDGDYARMVRQFEHAVGIPYGWALLWTCLLTLCPVWVVAWRRDRSGRSRRRLLAASLVTVVLDVALTLVAFMAVAIYLWDRRTQVASTVVMFLAMLVCAALSAWLARVIVPAHVEAAKPRWRVRVATGLVCAVAVFYVFNLVGRVAAGELDWVGTRPDTRQVAIRMGDFQIGKGGCSGVVRAGDDVWLVAKKSGFEYNLARRDDDLKRSDYLLGKLGQVPSRDTSREAGKVPDYEIFAHGGTVVSRLINGRFQVVTYLKGGTCLLPMPAAGKVLLFTAYEDWNAPSRENKLVFASSDKGRHWQRVNSGALADMAAASGSETEAFRVAPGKLWLWNDVVDRDNIPSAGRGYVFSDDGGLTREPLALPDDFASTVEDVVARAPADARAALKLNEVKRYVTPLSADKAILWRSAEFYGGDDVFLHRTDSVVVERENGRWQAGRIRHLDGVSIQRVQQSSPGVAYAVLNNDGSDDPVVAHLHNGTWAGRYSLPNPYWLFGDDVRLKGFWATNDTVVAKVWSSFSLPGEGRVETARVYYYSRDDGQSWSRLDMDYLFGIQGVSGADDEIYAEGYLRDGNTRAILGLRFSPVER